jgi:hypothetical protein
MGEWRDSYLIGSLDVELDLLAGERADSVWCGGCAVSLGTFLIVRERVDGGVMAGLRAYLISILLL